METGMELQSPGLPRTETRPFMKAINSFFLRVALLIFLSVDFSAILVYFLVYTRFSWPDLLPSILAVFCGLTTGVLARFLFPNTPFFIRWMLAVITNGIVLVSAGLVTREWMHTDLTAFQAALVQPDFFILVGIATFTAFAAVFAWRRKRVVETVSPRESVIVTEPALDYDAAPSIRQAAEKRPTSEPNKRSESMIPKGTRKKYFRKSSLRRWKRKISSRLTALDKFFKRSIVKPVTLFFHPGSRVVITGRHKAEARLQIQVPDHRTVAPDALPVNLPRKHSGRKMRHSVRLTGKEEMKCPYCLQPVDPKDTKGIVICPICHTAHHKECWDITGSCQVPHNHAML